MNGVRHNAYNWVEQKMVLVLLAQLMFALPPFLHAAGTEKVHLLHALILISLPSVVSGIESAPRPPIEHQEAKQWFRVDRFSILDLTTVHFKFRFGW
jgi:hypothetical protein